MAWSLPMRGSGSHWYGAEALAGQHDPRGRLRGFFHHKRSFSWSATTPGSNGGRLYLSGRGYLCTLIAKSWYKALDYCSRATGSVGGRRLPRVSPRPEWDVPGEGCSHRAPGLGRNPGAQVPSGWAGDTSRGDAHV